MTRAVIDPGLHPDQVTLFEVNPTFASHLRTRFPGVHVVNAGAPTIAAHCPDGVAAIMIWFNLPPPGSAPAVSGDRINGMRRYAN